MFSGFPENLWDYPLPSRDPFGDLVNDLLGAARHPPPSIHNWFGRSRDKVPTEVYKVMFDLKQFHPDDVTVKVVDEDTIVVHAKHEEKPDDHGFISREFTRKHKLPSDVSAIDMRAIFNKNGILVISIPYKTPRPEEKKPEDKGRSILIDWE